MWRIIIVVVSLCTALPARAEKLYVTTEDYSPYNFRSVTGEPAGVYIDQLKIIFSRTGTDYEATILPWARAIALAETKDRHCVVAAARTPGREHRFKWVSPVHIDRNVLVALKGSALAIKTIKDAKRYMVGTQRNDYTADLLKSMGFPRVDFSADFDTTLAKLVAGRIDLMPMSESALRKLSSDQFAEATVLTYQKLGMACNKTVPDALIRRMQSVLDEMIANGTQRDIFEKYGLVIRD